MSGRDFVQAIPIGGLLAYNLVSTGHLFHPAYDYQYRMEAWGYPALGYRPDWAIEDLRYLPQNLALMLTRLPELLPACEPGASRGIFEVACPYARLASTAVTFSGAFPTVTTTTPWP